MPVWMDDRKSERQRKARLVLARNEYSLAMRQVNNLLLGIDDSDEKNAVLNFAMKTVKRDIISYGRAAFLYGPNPPHWNRFIPVPDNYREKSHMTLDLSNASVLAVPWHYGSLLGAILTLLRSPFDQKKSLYSGDYYPELDLAVIENGQHHVAVASLERGGTVTVSQICHLTSMFNVLETDGAHWIDHLSQQPPLEVEDFRFALLYTLAKMRHGLECKQIETQSEGGNSSMDDLLRVKAEALHETAMNLWHDFTRYRDQHGIADEEKELITLMENKVFDCSQKAIYVKTQEDLDRLRGELDFAQSCLHGLKEQDNDNQPT